MNDAVNDVIEFLLVRLALVRQSLGLESPGAGGAGMAIGDLLDSMALVEYLAIVAEDCGVEPQAIEHAVRRRFGTVAELAAAMHAAGLRPRMTTGIPGGEVALRTGHGQAQPVKEHEQPTEAGCWLASVTVCLPETVQAADTMNRLLQRPGGWLESHAGIESRNVWGDQDPIAAAVAAGSDSLDHAGLTPADIGALLVTSEAPPQITGLAAALHHRLQLGPRAVALEIGGACTGFLAALWVARAIVTPTAPVLVLAVEAPSRWLPLHAGPAGEAAALFGDAAASTVVCALYTGKETISLDDVILGCDGSAGPLLQVQGLAAGSFGVVMDGPTLATKAVKVMANAVHDVTGRHGLSLSQLAGIVAHGGNGRLPALLARRLKLPAESVWSASRFTGNLGSTSLPVAWAMHATRDLGPVVWTTVGAGLTWAAALTGHRRGRNVPGE
jgi:3-oxoacyl-[acyl-carrier-protein] synthase-3